MKYYLLTASLDHLTYRMDNKYIQQKHESRIAKLNVGDKIVLCASKIYYGQFSLHHNIAGIVEIVDDKYEIITDNEKKCSIKYRK